MNKMINNHNGRGLFRQIIYEVYNLVLHQQHSNTTSRTEQNTELNRQLIMIKLKKLLPEENKKSKYELLMDLIDDFLELRDGFETRMIDIEKKLKELKPELSSIDTRLNPDDFSTDDYLQSSDDNDIEKE